MKFNFPYYLIFNLFFAAIFISTASAQWVNDPASNTKLVVDVYDPVNINAVSDGKGGTYLIWQDKPGGFQTDVFFLHVDNSGKVSFRADGKTVSQRTGPKKDPVSVEHKNNTAIIVWHGTEDNNQSGLFAQRVESNGNRLWGSRGSKVTQDDSDVSDYSVFVGEDGTTKISYLLKEPGFTGDYDIMLAVLDDEGFVTSDSAGSLIHKSNLRKSRTNVVASKSGQTFIFWLENVDGKSVIRSVVLDSLNKKITGRTPLTLSDNNKSVISYSVQSFGINAVYINWQYQGGEKDIFHQVISSNGKLLWGNKGKKATNFAGVKSYPKSLVAGSNIFLTWTTQTSKKEIMIQKFNVDGKELFKQNGRPVLTSKNDQFSQQIISDGNDGFLIAWINKKVDSLYGNIIVQKFDENAVYQWDSTGVELGSHYNSQKSYLNLVPDGSGGTIAIFKDSRNGKSEIYGQKVFSTGTYASHILGLATSIVGDSVKIYWYSANESEDILYEVHRTKEESSSIGNWESVGKVEVDRSSAANYYEFLDWPGENGVYFYRVVQKDENGNQQYSDISRVNYLEHTSDVIVAQNFPNPFNDSTFISFYLPEKMKVKIKFYNSQVEMVNEIDETYDEGKHQIAFSADGLKPGIYFYRFEAGDVKEVKKMIITK